MFYHAYQEDSRSFYPGDLVPMKADPSEELLSGIGWRRDVYDFQFYEASIFRADETPTNSWIEVAYSRQLGAAFVIWFSGVSGLEAQDFCTYGWINCADLGQSFSDGFFRKSLLQRAPIIGYHRNLEVYSHVR